MRLFALVFLLLASFILYSQQNEIDSLKNALLHQTGLNRIKSLNELSWHYKNIDLDSAHNFALDAVEFSQKIDSKDAIAASYNSVANVLEAKGNLDSALILHAQSLQIKIELEDSIGMADSYNNIGIAHDELGQYNLALENYFKALRLYESLIDEFKTAMVFGNIGIVYKKQKEYPKVLEYYARALQIYESVGSDFGIMVTKGNIGSMMLHTGEFTESIKFSNDAMKDYEEAGYLRYVPYMKSNIGIALDSLGEYIEARTYYLEAVDEHDNHENQYELASTLGLLASNYNKTESFAASEDAAQKAYEISLGISALEFQSKALNEWSAALAGLNKFDQAYAKILLRNDLKDQLFEETKTKQIFELQTEYETEKKEQQIALQEFQLSSQKAQIERNRFFTIALIVTVISVIGLWLLNRSRLRKKQQIILQEEKLHIKEAEINATISSQEKERARYARDLHDGFGQMISILNMNLGNLKKDAKPQERQEVFKESEKVIGEMYDELKGICFDLMPQTLVKNGIQSGLEEFAERINKAGKVFIETNFFGLGERLSEIQEISLYRISQEWINNILKYSDATKVTLQITRDLEEITLLIEDNGIGFNKSTLLNSKGNGWKNLNTRTNLINGSLELETQPGIKGNTLIVNAPSILDKTEKHNENTVATV